MLGLLCVNELTDEADEEVERFRSAVTTGAAAGAALCACNARCGPTTHWVQRAPIRWPALPIQLRFRFELGKSEFGNKQS